MGPHAISTHFPNPNFTRPELLIQLNCLIPLYRLPFNCFPKINPSSFPTLFLWSIVLCNSSLFKVTIYVDRRVTSDSMESVVSDLLNISPDVKVINNSDDWSEFQFIVFSNLNAAPGISDQAYAKAMKNLFEKHLPMAVDNGVNIVFGQNFRGLIAMHELVKLRQDLKKNCVAVSSIVFLGRQVKLDSLKLTLKKRY